MYIPKVFEIENRDELFDFIEQWSFGDLVTTYKGKLFVNHAPFIVDKSQNKLYGHFAIKNPQLNWLEKADDLIVVFKGPHSYISPNWYVSEEMVPTWNFESVQIRGKAKLVSSEKLLVILEKLTEKHESQFASPWTTNRVSESNLNRIMNFIVGFEIEISSIIGKSKLSQNRNEEDRLGVISGLRSQNNSMASVIANKMQLSTKS